MPSFSVAQWLENWHFIASNYLQLGQEHHFDKYNLSYVDTLNTSYDYGSVMHYPRDAFSANGNFTIIPKNPTATIGQRITLSSIDVIEVQRFYECEGLTATKTLRVTDNNAFTTSSPRFRRINGVSSDYYYLIKQVIISVAGSYKFSSTSAVALYYYLYRDSFNSSDPTSNLVEQGSNSGNGIVQDQFTVSLPSTSSGRKRVYNFLATCSDDYSWPTSIEFRF